MIEIVHHYGIIPIRTCWYAPRPHGGRLGFVRFGACADSTPVPGYVRKSGLTKLIDITPEPEQILKSLGKNNVYKIRRAEREGVTTAVLDLDRFLAFYNANRPAGRPLMRSGLLGYGRQLDLRGAFRSDGELLVAHSHLLDPESGQARFFHSARLDRPGLSNVERNFIGMANRLLHYREICDFRAAGLRIYDFGGYYAGEEDKKLKAIAAFKDSFGGRVAEQTSYYSLPYWLLLEGYEKVLALRARLARRAATSGMAAPAGAED